MTADEPGLRAAVAARLSDDTPRLVLADCLDESGRSTQAALLRAPGRYEWWRASGREYVRPRRRPSFLGLFSFWFPWKLRWQTRAGGVVIKSGHAPAGVCPGCLRPRGTDGDISWVGTYWVRAVYHDAAAWHPGCLAARRRAMRAAEKARKREDWAVKFPFKSGRVMTWGWTVKNVTRDFDGKSDRAKKTTRYFVQPRGAVVEVYNRYGWYAMGILLYAGDRFGPVTAEMGDGRLTFEGVIEKIVEDDKGRLVFHVRCAAADLTTGEKW